MTSRDARTGFSLAAPGGAASALPVFGPYQLVASLGPGPVATSYLCRKEGQTNDDLAVISIVHDELSNYRWLIDQLLADVALCARIAHPNIEGIVDSGVLDQHGYVVTRYVDGCTLGRMMEPSFRLPLRIGLPLVVDMLRGLQAAHSLLDARGKPSPLVHSGVAPASILVGRDGLARVTEFGIARVQMSTTQTMPGVRSERFAHLSPEQVQDSGEIDARADIFAVGTVLWSLATGQPLFRGEDAVASMHRVLHVEAPAPSTVGWRPAQWLDPICLRALRKGPPQRYATAEQMAADLHMQAIQHQVWASRAEIAEFVEGVLPKADPERATTAAAPSGRASFRKSGLPSLAMSPTSRVGTKVWDSGSRTPVAPKGRRRILVAAGIAVLVALAFGLGIRAAQYFAARSQSAPAGAARPSPVPPASETPTSAPSVTAVRQPPPTEPVAPPVVAVEELKPLVPVAPAHPGSALLGGRTAPANPVPNASPASAGAGATTAAPGAAGPTSTGPAAPPGAPPLPTTVESNPYLRHSR